jgi:hypothetical protein
MPVSVFTHVRAVSTGWISLTFSMKICPEIHYFVTIGQKESGTLHVLLLLVTLNHLISTLFKRNGIRLLE